MCVLPHVWLWETNACGLREKCLFGKINEFVHENFNLLNEWEQFHHGSWGQLSHTSIHYGQIFQMLSNNYKAFYSPKLYLEIQGCNQRGDWCDRSCNTSFIYSWSIRNILELWILLFGPIGQLRAVTKKKVFLSYFWECFFQLTWAKIFF